MNMRRVKPWLSASKESKESMSASESYRGASFCGICGRGRLSGEPTWPDCMHMDFVVCFYHETSEFLSEYSQLNSARATWSARAARARSALARIIWGFAALNPHRSLI